VAALVEGVSHVLVALVFAGDFLVSVSLQIAVVRGRACVNFAHVGFVAACSGGWMGAVQTCVLLHTRNEIIIA